MPASLSDVKRKNLEKRLIALHDEYNAANDQLSRTLGEVERRRLDRAISNLEQEIQKVENELSQINRPDTSANIREESQATTEPDSGVKIGNVEGGIHGSIIAGRDVSIPNSSTSSGTQQGLGTATKEQPRSGNVKGLVALLIISVIVGLLSIFLFPNTTLAVILLLIAAALFLATKIGFITDLDLQRWANVAAVVAMLAAVVVFVVPNKTPSASEPATASASSPEPAILPGDSISPTTTPEPTPTGTPMPVPTPTVVTTQAQQVRWGPNDNRDAGICVMDGCSKFIPWEDLKVEVETKLLPQVANVPGGSTVTLGNLLGKPLNWTVEILDPSGNKIGYVWFGHDPDKEWAFDGLVRVGNVENDAWATFQRYSDGSYRKQ